MRLADENVGGVPVEVKTIRMESIMIEMKGSVQIIEWLLEDKAMAKAKAAMVEYAETLVAPWSWYDNHLTVSTKEIVEQMESQKWPLAVLLGGDGLISWQFSHADMADKGYTGEQWANILGVEINAPSFVDALIMWEDVITHG